MTVDKETVSVIPRPRSGVIVVDAARELVAGLDREPWGQVSASVYETARLVALAPWLTGHAERLAHLLRQQRADGGWGGPDGYDLVPTLSATEAILTTLRGSGVPPGAARDELIGAANRGLRALSGWLSTRSAASLPDTPAVDLIVPAMVDVLNRHLCQLSSGPVSGLDAWCDVHLELPAGMAWRRLEVIRHLLSSGMPVPDKLLHALEVAGDLAQGASGVSPLVPGTVGASPAATAAWLGDSIAVGAVDARAYLEEVVGRNAGLAPCTTPITVFERSWVISGLIRVGVPITVAPDLRRSLAVDLGPTGTPAGPGLPTDADTTSVTLYALALLGEPVEPECLWTYDTGSHFCTWPGEDGFSISTNAHVLDAFGHHLRNRSGTASRYHQVVDRLSGWLCEQQQPDGSWWDRWHASPYYATASCVLALDRYGVPERAADAVDRARKWVVERQRPDGSWGRWTGTLEETAYALHVLLGTDRPATPHVVTAVRRGYDYLTGPGRSVESQPPLWHDKDLYRPDAIVRGAILGALWLGQQRSDLTDEYVFPQQKAPQAT